MKIFLLLTLVGCITIWLILMRQKELRNALAFKIIFRLIALSFFSNFIRMITIESVYIEVTTYFLIRHLRLQCQCTFCLTWEIHRDEFACLYNFLADISFVIHLRRFLLDFSLYLSLRILSRRYFLLNIRRILACRRSLFM